MKLKFKPVPFSSVVGSSIMVTNEDGRTVAILAIMVPSPQDDYKTVAQEVIDAVCAKRAPTPEPRDG